MKLSKHFSLDEAIFSETAARVGLTNIPSQEVQLNMMKAAQFLEQFREHINKPINITSWYRSQELNELIPGSSKTSAHVTGLAIDCNVLGISPCMLCKLASEFFKEYDQIIHEYGRWMHISFDTRNRKQNLTIFKHPSKRYVRGFLTQREYTLS